MRKQERRPTVGGSSTVCRTMAATKEVGVVQLHLGHDAHHGRFGPGPKDAVCRQLKTATDRGWSGEQQQDARTRLAERGLLNESGLTTEGAVLRSHVESTTDLRAAEPYERALHPNRRAEMLAKLERVADDIIRSETIPFPNPMGLPHPSLPPA